LRETLPDRDDFLRLLDWNVEEPPFFAESAHVAGGNLALWAEAQGGVGAIPLDRRLDLLARVADAVAAAHSVGVLHKDLKPGNVLVLDTPQGARIRLADFGSGGVVDPELLAAHGITRMGFTQAVPAGQDTSGTPVYLAPEVLAGQPFTVQSDVYALGVMLYQLIAGDLRKTLAPGWEKDVADELLREDIALAAAGNPADRLGDAAALAQRLRDLERRCQERADEALRRAQTARTQQLREQVRRLRTVAATLVIATGVAAAAGAYAFHARNEARRAAATTAAVNEFLNEDLLASADPRRGPTRNLTVRAMLDRAAGTVDARFAGEPAAAGEIHATLGRAYQGIGEFVAARAALERAAALFDAVDGEFSARGFEVRQRLVNVLQNLGQRQQSCVLAQSLLEQARARLPDGDERVLTARLAHTRCRLLGDVTAYDGAIADLALLVEELEVRGLHTHDAYAAAVQSQAMALFDSERYAAAATSHRKVVAGAERAYGPGHVVTIRGRAMLAGALMYAGELAEADAELGRAWADLRQWSGEDTGDGEYLRIWEGLLRLEQGRFDEAERLARQCLTSPLGQQRRGTFRTSGLFLLGEALLERDPVQGLAHLREAVEHAAAQNVSRRHYDTPARAIWAGALLRLGRIPEAEAVLRQVDEADVAALNRSSWRYALLRRAQGLLWLEQGRSEEGRAALKDSRDIYQSLYGPAHWRTRRAVEEHVRALRA
jgi:eukaryotic-like serine/threonine-protein kinase